MEMKENIKVIAPGRICLFGDHQDYLGLPVIACAINRSIQLKAVKNKSAQLKISMPDINEERTFDFKKEITIQSNRDYLASALHVLKRYDCVPGDGYDIIIKGDIPVNAGLSSSSAVLVAWVTFLLEAFGSSQIVDASFIARLSYEAEVLEFNAPGGLMDQYAISLGGTIFLNTLTGDHIPISKSIHYLIIGESGVPKETLEVLGQLGSLAKKTIAQVQNGVPTFKIADASISTYKEYQYLVNENLRPIFLAAINNYLITKEALLVMQQDQIDLVRLGELMDAHHFELKEHLKITVPIIDSMIDGAKQAGALGAKIVGSGGGGCIVALASPVNESQVIAGILKGGAKSAYKIEISKGVQVI